MLLFDLDGLKKINDKYGHLTGSRAIKRLGNALRNSSRTIDTPARYGGDEFASFLPEAGKQEAEQAAMRICEQSCEMARNRSFPSAWVRPCIRRMELPSSNFWARLIAGSIR